MNNSYTWILTPIDLNNLYNYGCYNDEISDFLDDNNIKNHTCYFYYKYSIRFDLDNVTFNNIVNKLINFKTGRFKTSSIHIKTNNGWTKI